MQSPPPTLRHTSACTIRKLRSNSKLQLYSEVSTVFLHILDFLLVFSGHLDCCIGMSMQGLSSFTYVGHTCMSFTPKSHTSISIDTQPSSHATSSYTVMRFPTSQVLNIQSGSSQPPMLSMHNQAVRDLMLSMYNQAVPDLPCSHNVQSGSF